MSISGAELTILAEHALGRGWITTLARRLKVSVASVQKWKLHKVPRHREYQVLELMNATAQFNLRSVRTLSRHIEIEIWKRARRAQVKREHPREPPTALARSRRKALRDYDRYRKKHLAAHRGHERRRARLAHRPLDEQ